MNLLHLEYFRTIAKYQNLTRAGEELHVSQSTLSYSLKILEQELGLKLFERQGKSLVLNNNGEELLKSANSILYLLDSKKRLSELAGTPDVKEIVIGGLSSDGYIQSIMTEYMESYPDVVFRTISRGQMDNSRSASLADFIITDGSDTTISKNRLLIGHRSIYTLISKDHPLAANETVDITDLSEHPQIMCAPPDKAISTIHSLCMKSGMKSRVRFITDDRFSALMMVSNGTHIMFAPEAEARLVQNITSGNIVARPITGSDALKEWASDIYLTWNDEKKLSEQAKEFIRFIKHFSTLVCLLEHNEAKYNLHYC